jgi:hypothetical protein
VVVNTCLAGTEMYRLLRRKVPVSIILKVSLFIVVEQIVKESVK